MKSLLLLSILFLATNAGVILQLELSLARYDLVSVSVGTKVIFAGGILQGGLLTSNLVNVYDTNSSAWLDLGFQLSLGGRHYATATSCGSQALIAGGLSSVLTLTSAVDAVDIYNDELGTWTSASLSLARYGLVSCSLDTLAFFLGGEISDNSTTTVCDIYNSTSGEWTTSDLPNPRAFGCACAVGTKVIYAGGTSGSLNLVDMYDTVTANWTSTEVVAFEDDVVCAVLGSQAFFADSNANGTVYVYDAELDLWGTLSISLPHPGRTNMVAICDGAHILFAGGSVLNENLPLDVIDIYDVESDSWDIDFMTTPREYFAAASIGAEIYFAGGVAEVNLTTLLDIATSFIDVFVFESGTNGTNSTNGTTPTPVPTPTPEAPTPNPAPTPVVFNCAENCQNQFHLEMGLWGRGTSWSNQCSNWTNFKLCLAKCANSTNLINQLLNQCKATPFAWELCPACGNGTQANATRVCAILIDFVDIFKIAFGKINGVVITANIELNLTSSTSFTIGFEYENTIATIASIRIAINAWLADFLNYPSGCFQFSDGSNNNGNQKRAQVAGQLNVQVVSAVAPPDAPATPSPEGTPSVPTPQGAPTPEPVGIPTGGATQTTISLALVLIAIAFFTF